MDTLEDFFESCPEMLFSADEGSALLRHNPALARFLGEDAGRGAKLSDRVHPADRAAFEAGWAKVAATSAGVTFEIQLRDGGGVYQRVACKARRGGARGEVHGSLRDLGEERAHDAGEMERQTAILRAIEENLPITVWMVEEPGIFVHHEGKSLEVVGQRSKGRLGVNIFDLPATEDIFSAIRRAFAGEGSHAFAIYGGAPWEIWYLPVRGEEGKGNRVVGIGLDVTEVKRTEGELREKLAVIERQKEVIRALGTPIIEVWDKVLTLPISGVIDSGRAAAVMDDLLNAVSRKGARFAILDLTGVEAMDTSTASHLLKLIQALGLLGAEGVISGIQPSVAQTMIALGLDLGKIRTLANLRDALRFCMREGG